MGTFAERITSYTRAGYPALAIETAEESRAMADILAAARASKRGLAVWSCTEGLKIKLPEAGERADTQDPIAMIGAAAQLQKTIVVLRDLQAFTPERDPVLSRGIRDLLSSGPEAGRTVIFLGPTAVCYPSIAKLVTVLDYALPNVGDLQKIVKGIAESCGCKDDGNGDVLRALSGLSVAEAENALALSFVEGGSFDPAIIYREKIQAVKRSGLLELTNPDPAGIAGIGGLATLKAWILERRNAYSPEAEAYGLPAPKGVLICGVPGTGKSLAAKAIGTALGIPTLKLDLGALFGSLVGESEKRAREALALAEAIAPCVLVWEELDKGLAGASGGSGDSGTSKRVFGTLLNWLQDRKAPVFVVATANDVTALPPETYRRGRWDEVFSVDLPTLAERADIASVQAGKHVKDDEAFKRLEGMKIAEATDGYTGAEIESAIVGALFRAYADKRRRVTTQDVLAVLPQIVPLSRMAKTQVDAIRAWARANARNAGEPEKSPKASARQIG